MQKVTSDENLRCFGGDSRTLRGHFDECHQRRQLWHPALRNAYRYQQGAQWYSDLAHEQHWKSDWLVAGFGRQERYCLSDGGSLEKNGGVGTGIIIQDFPTNQLEQPGADCREGPDHMEEGDHRFKRCVVGKVSS